MALASTQDFEARHGEGDDRVAALLGDASSLILSEVEGSQAPWVVTPPSDDDDTPTVPNEVVAVCCAVAFRAWSNPEALSSEALGEHTVAWANRSGETLFLTSQERRTLKRAAKKSSFQSATLTTPYSGDGDGSNPLRENDVI